MPLERLQKILSEAGVASRREAERMMAAGRVRVNDAVVTKAGTKADPARDRITVDGKRIALPSTKVYYLFHKPVNVMVTRRDPQGRPTIYEYLRGIPERVNYVGRLDFDSEGLLFLTNDGGLLARMTHPRHEVPKVYQVKIKGRLSEADIQVLQGGINLEGSMTRPCRVKVLKDNPHNQWIEMTLIEGKNRQVRRMMAKTGHEVLRLVRTAIGPLSLGGLKKGAWRRLTPLEIRQLKG